MFYGYATGTFSARKIERATYESMPFHFLAGGLHPDHDTIANFRKTFLPELKDLFVHILLYAQELGVLTLGNISLDGTKIHADASKSSAISYKRLLELDSQLRTEVDTVVRPHRARRADGDARGVGHRRCNRLSPRAAGQPGQGESRLRSPGPGTL